MVTIKTAGKAVDIYGEAGIKKVPLKQRIRPYIILGPSLLLTAGILIPFAISIYLSLTNYSFKYQGYSFVGLENWMRMLSSPSFWHGFFVTLKFAFFATVIEMVLGFAIALLLNRDNWLSRSLRIILIFPLMIAPVIATLIWQLMTNQSVGILTKWLSALGIENFTWGADPRTALFSVVIIDIWVFTPFVILLVLAGLQSLPKSPFEAALIDGGSPWFTFKNLTLPMIMPYALIALLFRLMLSLQEFSIIFALTRGGPGDTLMSLSLLAYTEAFTYKELGSALPFMLFLWLIIYVMSYFLVKYWSNAQKRASGR